MSDEQAGDIEAATHALIAIDNRPKMDSRGLVSARCRCGFSTSPDTVHGAVAAFYMHATAGLRNEVARLTEQHAAAVRERDELRDALAAAVSDDAIEAGYASGWDDARTLVQAHINNAEGEEWTGEAIQPLLNIAEDMDHEDHGPGSLRQWLNLVWKQAIDDRDAAWAALTALDIDPRHPNEGVARALASPASPTSTAPRFPFADRSPIDQTGTQP